MWNPNISGIRTEEYLYIENEGDIAELYDVRGDPYLLENQVSNPDYAALVAELSERLHQETSGAPPTPTQEP